MHAAATIPVPCSLFPRAYRPHRQGSADPFSLKTLHWRVFQALEPSKPAKSASAPDEKFTRQLTTLIARYFPRVCF